MKELAQSHPEKVIDMLSERLTFEQAGVRLYDAILEKMRASDDPEVEKMLDPMEEHRGHEQQHCEFLIEQIESLGGDVDVKTDLARLIETESEGIEKVILNGTSNIAYLFHALLAAELVDNAGWDLLVRLAVEAGDKTAEREFKKCLRQEDDHLEFCRKVVERYSEQEIFGEPVEMPISP